jgi:hypothetical protein
VFRTTSKEKIVGKTPKGLDIVLGKKNVRATVEVDLVLLAVP